jgi:uncharacterized membrane protein
VTYPPTAVWGWVLAIHILCAVIWVGGMFFAIVVLRPSIAGLEPAQRVAMHNRVFRRFFLVIWHVMPIALITGFVMAFVGPAGLPWNVQAMMGLGVIMAVVFLAVVFGPYRRFRSAVSSARAGEAAERIRRLIELNLALGVITVILAAL